MKKAFYLPIAFLALAACTRSEVAQDKAEAIGFRPNALNTKALILPGSDENADFPQDQTFNVFAFADLDGPNADAYKTIYKTPLMNDVEISYKNGDWKATTGTYIWPATGTVDFYAYHPGSISASFDSTAVKLNLSGVNLGGTVGSQIDPLVAGIGNQLASAKPKPKVPLVFKHIASQIAVTAYDATKTTSLQGKIFIKGVKFLNMRTSGDYTEGTTIGAGEWTKVNGITDFTSFSGKLLLDVTESYLSDGAFSNAIDNSAAFVVIPGPVMTEAADNPQAIEVKYEIGPYNINGFNYPATPEQTFTLKLSGLIGGNTFQNGKRYIFHIGISLDGANNEIMFSPTVDSWINEDINGITIDAVNNGLM